MNNTALIAGAQSASNTHMVLTDEEREKFFANGKVPFTAKNLFPFAVVNTLFFGDWGTGRDKYKKLQQAEISRMMTYEEYFQSFESGTDRCYWQ